MGDEFVIKNLGNLKYFLRMEIGRSKEGISISQRKYALVLPIETSMIGCRPADTPIKFNAKLGNFVDKVPIDKENYQCLVEKLIYLSHTRSEVSYAVKGALRPILIQTEQSLLSTENSFQVNHGSSNGLWKVSSNTIMYILEYMVEESLKLKMDGGKIEEWKDSFVENPLFPSVAPARIHLYACDGAEKAIYSTSLSIGLSLHVTLPHASLSTPPFPSYSLSISFVVCVSISLCLALLSLRLFILGNERIAFWLDPRESEIPFNSVFPRLFGNAILPNSSVANIGTLHQHHGQLFSTVS
ncbi:putative mitochondrial protein [Cucumis melo var. makuwa]|uniref:Mitochondrial protein n=1 Tax=Cucumis melo var. makuwa TaxID=1194695 RepID=A0A5A7UZ98_CUCMM|nr:putative mitochondrial protein [Cucumis melo var. makuwa]